MKKYYLAFKEGGALDSVSIQEERLDGVNYLEAKEGFDPLLEDAALVNQNIIYSLKSTKSDPTQVELIQKQIREKYEFHETKGASYIKDFRAWLVSQVLMGIVTKEQAFVFEMLVRDAVLIIKNGDWLTGQHELDKIKNVEDFNLSSLNKMKEDVNKYIEKYY